MEAKKLIELLEETNTLSSEVYVSTSNKNFDIKEIKICDYGIEIVTEDKEKTDYLKELVNDLLSRLEEFESASETIKHLLNIGYDRKQILKMGFFEEDYNWASKELQDEICGEE